MNNSRLSHYPVRFYLNTEGPNNSTGYPTVFIAELSEQRSGVAGQDQAIDGTGQRPGFRRLRKEEKPCVLSPKRGC